MILFQLAQDVVVTAAEEPGRLLGLTVNEWLLLLPFVVAAIVNVIQAIKGSKDGKKLQAAIHAIEETAEHHPEAVKLVKEKAKEKATEHGVQAGLFGLDADVKKLTGRIGKRVE